MSGCCDICNHCAWKLDDLAERLARVTAERDEARRLHSEAEGQIECRNEMRATIAQLRADLARVTAERDAAHASLAKARAEIERADTAAMSAIADSIALEAERDAMRAVVEVVEDVRWLLQSGLDTACMNNSPAWRAKAKAALAALDGARRR